jgi:hypothetical protein
LRYEIVLPNRADGRDRTGDIRFTKPVLYQLSYVGVGCIVALRLG